MAMAFEQQPPINLWQVNPQYAKQQVEREIEISIESALQWPAKIIQLGRKPFPFRRATIERK